MHLSPPVALAAVRSKGGGSVVVESLFILICSYCLWGFVFGPCFVMQYLVSFLVFATISLRKTGKECWLLYFFCLPAVL